MTPTRAHPSRVSPLIRRFGFIVAPFPRSGDRSMRSFGFPSNDGSAQDDKEEPPRACGECGVNIYLGDSPRVRGTVPRIFNVLKTLDYTTKRLGCQPPAPLPRKDVGINLRRPCDKVILEKNRFRVKPGMTRLLRYARNDRL